MYSKTFYQVLVSGTLGVSMLWGCSDPTSPIQPVSVTASKPTPSVKQLAVDRGPRAVAAALGFVYVANQDAGTVSVIDTATDAIAKVLPLPDGAPVAVTTFRDGKNVLVLDRKQGKLLVLDPQADHAVLQTIALGGAPESIVIGETDRTAVVAFADQPSVSYLTFEADRSQPPAIQKVAVGTAAKQVRIAHDSIWAVASNTAENQVHLIDTRSGQTHAFTEGLQPGPVAIGIQRSLSGRRATVVLAGNQEPGSLGLYPIDGSEKVTLTDVGLMPTAIAIDEELTQAFVAMAGSNQVTVVDYRNMKVQWKIPVGNRPTSLALVPTLPPTPPRTGYALRHLGGGSVELWVGNEDSGSVTVVEAESFETLTTIATGEGHHEVAFWGDKAYVTNSTSNTVSVVDRKTLY